MVGGRVQRIKNSHDIVILSRQIKTVNQREFCIGFDPIFVPTSRLDNLTALT